MSLEGRVSEPVLEVSEFCRRTGAEESKVKRQLQERNIPPFVFSDKKGAKQYVNMRAIERMAEEQAEKYLLSISNS